MSQGFLLLITNNTSLTVVIGTSPNDNCFNTVPGLQNVALAPSAIAPNSPLYIEVSGTCNNAVMNLSYYDQAQQPRSQGNAVIAFDKQGSVFANGATYITSFTNAQTSKQPTTYIMPYLIPSTSGEWTQANVFLVEMAYLPAT